MRLQPMSCLLTAAWLLAGGASPGTAKDKPAADVPQAADPRLEVRLFAAAPEIVHPISIDCDAKGRLLVIESHTHFRPDGYKGPKFDRIRMLEDKGGDGKADRFTTFFEGTKATMDLAVHPDGSVYVATRSEILRLRDTKGDGKADEKQRVIFLDTKGDYPHNGLSGLAFDSRGNLYFGLGENLGADYKLVGADGTTLTGGGEGGNVFWCTADGKKLRRVATGFWNPFGTCRDIFGRLFTVDNDPDAMPPCRMLHLVEGGDYGYQFRYGRSGRHIFQAWNGELPGTLPMVTGTGEAPCEIISYESDGLPREYLGSLLVASWADHRIERYVPRPKGASFTADRLPFIQGGKDFRPVGLAVAPDGSLFISDWVLSNYQLHNKGAIWHVQWKQGGKSQRPQDPKKALLSLHRPLREAAARRLAGDDVGRDVLRRHLSDSDSRVRAICLTALLDVGDRKLDLAAIADSDKEEALRAMAVRALVTRGEDVGRFLGARNPNSLRMAAIGSLRTKDDLPHLVRLLSNGDPFLHHAAVHQLGQFPDLLAAIDRRNLTEAGQRTGLLLAHRASGRTESRRLVPDFLADPLEDVRFLAAKWVSDEKLTEFRPQIEKALKDKSLNVRMYSAYATALARIDNQDVNETRMAEYFLQRAADDKSPADARAMALRLVPATHPKLTVDLLGKLLQAPDPRLQLETARALSEHPSPQRFDVLKEVVKNVRLSRPVRAQALAGLSETSGKIKEELVQLAGDAPLGDEALRALIQTPLTTDQRAGLAKVADKRPAAAALVARVLGQPFAKDRPPVQDLEAWVKRLDGPADPEAGRRIFFHAKLAGCYRCHRVEGRGRDLGPDLDTIGRRGKKHILESILQPSLQIAPSYQNWIIETKDGKTHTGMLVRTVLDEYTYLDSQGNLFKLNTSDMAAVKPAEVSVMPSGLADLLTDQELRDLIAYLMSLSAPP